MTEVQTIGVVWRRARRAVVGSAAGALVVATLALSGVTSAATNASSLRKSYIVQGSSMPALRTEISATGGGFVVGLPLIHGAVARLSLLQVSELSHISGITLTVDHTVTMTSSSSATAALTGGPVQNFPSVTNTTPLWSRGDIGKGVTVALLDTGIDASLPDLAGRVIDGVDLTGGNSPYTDQYGHGTFIAGLIAGNGASSGGTYTGEAPGADLVSIKVAGANGVTSEGTVIQGIEWAIQHANGSDNISVLNLSLGVAPSGPAASDPLDQAVEAAWNSGITVVTSAGNAGPSNGSITSPGDDPLVITVGAVDSTGGSSPSELSIPSFSSVGPTQFDGYFKPDVVAPGRSVVSLADPGSTIYQQNPSAIVGTGNFVGSGTSFSAAITAGEVALLESQNPYLTPNQVKAALLLTASPGPVGNPLVDGHGVTNVAAAASASGVNLNQSGAVEPLHQTTSLSAAWAQSSWNPALWNRKAWLWLATEGAAWNGAAWNGAAWNGAAWNGAAWNGAAWNGAAWNGAAWNGTAWNGMAWNGATWNGMAWNGAAWNGAAWNGATWNGAAWNGAAWNGAAWNGAAWNGAAWNGAAWNASIWNGDSWG